jgi:hypothetical protein
MPVRRPDCESIVVDGSVVGIKKIVAAAIVLRTLQRLHKGRHAATPISWQPRQRSKHLTQWQYNIQCCGDGCIYKSKRRHGKVMAEGWCAPNEMRMALEKREEKWPVQKVLVDSL